MGDGRQRVQQALAVRAGGRDIATEDLDTRPRSENATEFLPCRRSCPQRSSSNPLIAQLERAADAV